MWVLRMVFHALKLGNRRERFFYACRVSLKDADLYPLDRYQSLDMDRCVDASIRNREMIHSYVASNGAKALTYLQPISCFGQRPLSPTDGISLAHFKRRMTEGGANQLEAMQEFYRRVAVEFEKRGEQGFENITGIFDACRLNSNLYVDPRHCSDIGYDIIARSLAEDILARERESESYTCPGDERRHLQ